MLIKRNQTWERVQNGLQEYSQWSICVLGRSDTGIQFVTVHWHVHINGVQFSVCTLYIFNFTKKNEKKVKTSTFDQDRVIRTKFTLPPQTTTTNINTWNKGSQENEYHQKWKVTSANEGPRSERPEKKQASDFSILLKGVCVQATAKDTRTKRDKVARVFRAVTRKETATQRTLKICRGTSLSI